MEDDRRDIAAVILAILGVVIFVALVWTLCVNISDASAQAPQPNWYRICKTAYGCLASYQPEDRVYFFPHQTGYDYRLVPYVVELDGVWVWEYGIPSSF